MERELRLTAKLLSQLEEPPMEIPFALTPRGNTSATRTHAPGYSSSAVEQLGRGKNGAYTPGITEVDLVDPHKHNSNPPGSLVSRPGRPERPIKTSDDEVRDAHAQRASNQDGLPAESVDVENSRDGCAEEEHTPDAAGEQRRGVSSETEVLEDEGRII
jgi:hypothetical protein